MKTISYTVSLKDSGLSNHNFTTLKEAREYQLNGINPFNKDHDSFNYWEEVRLYSTIYKVTTITEEII